MGLNFEIIPSTVEEVYDKKMNPLQVPEYLAEIKAVQVSQSLDSKEVIVIGADSVVILNGIIFEKPKDENDAFRMLAHLSGKTHTVVTGVCMIHGEEKVIFSGKSEVTFREMDAPEIERYIQQYQPFDKAGSYGIQDWLGLCKVSQIHGTYSNVMGLPTDLVYEGLKRWM